MYFVTNSAKFLEKHLAVSFQCPVSIPTQIFYLFFSFLFFILSYKYSILIYLPFVYCKLKVVVAVLMMMMMMILSTTSTTNIRLVFIYGDNCGYGSYNERTTNSEITTRFIINPPHIVLTYISQKNS